MEKRLQRSSRERMIAGVCGGLAEYLSLDPTLVRLVFVVLTLITGGVFGVVYLLLWVIMPEARTPIGSSTAAEETALLPLDSTAPAPEAGASAPVTEQPASSAPPRPRDLRIIGWVVLALGAYLLLRQLGLHEIIRYLWPLALVVVGVLLLWPHFRRR